MTVSSDLFDESGGHSGGGGGGGGHSGGGGSGGGHFGGGHFVADGYRGGGSGGYTARADYSVHGGYVAHGSYARITLDRQRTMLSAGRIVHSRATASFAGRITADQGGGWTVSTPTA